MSNLRRSLRRLANLVGILTLIAWAQLSPAAPDYAITRTVPLGVPDRWDYLAFDPSSSRVFVAHGSNITVVDGRDGRVVGQAGPLDGAHGEVVVPGLGRGYADGGKNASVNVFDLRTLRTIATLPAPADADAMAYDPSTRRMFVIGGESGVVTVIDTVSNRRAAIIPVGGSLEFAAADGIGHLFVNIADQRGVARIDTRTDKVTARWPIPDCVSPHGLAYDAATDRVFTSCVDGHLKVLDASDGHVVATLAIGRGSDAVAIDPGRRRAFSSNGDGTMSVITIADATNFKVTEIRTEPGARTMAVDPASGRLFTITASVAATLPPRVAGSAPRYSFVPGTVRLLMLDPR